MSKPLPPSIWSSSRNQKHQGSNKGNCILDNSGLGDSAVSDARTMRSLPSPAATLSSPRPTRTVSFRNLNQRVVFIFNANGSIDEVSSTTGKLNQRLNHQDGITACTSDDSVVPWPPSTVLSPSPAVMVSSPEPPRMESSPEPAVGVS